MEVSEVKKTRGKTYNAIDLTKFLCSILVVMIHIMPLGEYSNSSIVNGFNFVIKNYLARIAVPFFFVASGFFLYSKTTLSNFDVKFTKKYVLKLLKLYVIWTVIYLPLIIKGIVGNKDGIFYGVLSFIKNFIFTGSFVQLWYLPATMFAVILVSWLLKNKVTPKKILIIASGFYIVGLFAQSWFGFIEPLKVLVPGFWKLLVLLEKVMGTTRNGLFEGFIFVAMGMFFAFYEIKVSFTKLIIGFYLAMICLLIEFSLLYNFNFIVLYFFNYIWN